MPRYEDVKGDLNGYDTRRHEGPVGRVDLGLGHVEHVKDGVTNHLGGGNAWSRKVIVSACDVDGTSRGECVRKECPAGEGEGGKLG